MPAQFLTAALAGRSLSILCYHAVVDEPPPLDDFCFLHRRRFEAQMRWLAGSGLDVVALDEGVAALLAGRLRKPSVAITFDDGFRNNVEVALPVLRRHGFPATIYLSTGFTGTDRTTWPCRIAAALLATCEERLDWGGKVFGLSGQGARAAANAALQALVKERAAADPGRAAAEIEERLGVAPDAPVSRDGPFAMMDEGDVARARDSGLIAFGAHSVTHPILSALDDDALAFEIRESVRAVERLSGKSCTSFAYPNGRPQDFDARCEALLIEAGVRAALTTVQRPNRAGDAPLGLGRWVIGSATSQRRFKMMLSGVEPGALMARLVRPFAASPG